MEAGKIYVAADAGYAEVGAEQLASNSKITMQEWGRIKGSLMQTGKPVTNETLAVSFVRNFNPEQPWCNLQHRAVTDAQGRFEFDRVPPGEPNARCTAWGGSPGRTRPTVRFMG